MSTFLLRREIDIIFQAIQEFRQTTQPYSSYPMLFAKENSVL